MTQLVSHWKFQPALDIQGNPVKINVIMPVKIVARNEVPVVSFTLFENKDVQEAKNTIGATS